jgi:tRNA pseudouridine38-40 synthase
MSSRITALWCWYHGGPFRGYQSQAEGPTVQGELLTAMRACGFDRGPVAAGRTDLGVHARMQVISFRVIDTMAIEEVAPLLNARLPDGVGIAQGTNAPHKFSAQWKAQGKEYRYRLLLKDDPVWSPYAWRVDVEPARVEALLQRAVGTRDFWAFHEKASPRIPRTLSRVEVVQTAEGRVDVRLTGSGFGRYQVRYLVGGAVAVARGEIREEDFVAGIERAIEFRGTKAPAEGLTLWEVFYPPSFDPFAAAARAASAGVPREPPFI